MIEERRLANGHTKTGLPLGHWPAATSWWVEADGKIRQAEVCVRTRYDRPPARHASSRSCHRDGFLVAVLVAIQPRSTSFQRDRPHLLVQVELIGTGKIRAANAVWVYRPSGVQIPEPPQFEGPIPRFGRGPFRSPEMSWLQLVADR